MEVELGVPFTGWPVRCGIDYEFAMEVVSDSLRDDLLEWARLFNRNVDDSGWSSDEARSMHERQGLVLRDRLQAELGDGYRVTLISASF